MKKGSYMRFSIKASLLISFCLLHPSIAEAQFHIQCLTCMNNASNGDCFWACQYGCPGNQGNCLSCIYNKCYKTECKGLNICCGDDNCFYPSEKLGKKNLERIDIPL